MAQYRAVEASNVLTERRASVTQLALDHLQTLGHRRIIHVGGDHVHLPREERYAMIELTGATCSTS
jgi:DNA-binding LacI/PurR family transcriptional regulator